MFVGAGDRDRVFLQGFSQIVISTLIKWLAGLEDVPVRDLGRIGCSQPTIKVSERLSHRLAQT